MYLDRSIYVARVSAPLVGEVGYRAVRRPGEGAAPAVLDRVEAESAAVRVVPGMRLVDGRWLYSARWL